MNIVITLFLLFVTIRIIKFWFETKKPSPDIFAHIIVMRIKQENYKIHLYLLKHYKRYQAYRAAKERAKHQCPIFTYKYGKPSFFDARRCRDYNRQPVWGYYKEKEKND